MAARNELSLVAKAAKLNSFLLVSDLVGGERGMLVGRDAQLAQLRSAIADLNGNGSTMIEFVGGAGMGKTTLLDWLANELRVRGISYLCASGALTEQDLAFSVLASLLDASATDAQIQGKLDPYDAADLAAVLPNLRRELRLEASNSQADVLSVCHAVRSALPALVENSGAFVALLDDMHWSDEASAQVIGYLLRHPPEVPMLIISAKRPIDGENLLGQADVRPRIVEVIQLEPITPDDAEALVADLSTVQRDRVVFAAGGNPFYLTELAAAMQSNPDLREGEVVAFEGAAIPAALRESVAAQLLALSQNAQSLAKAASVLGDPFELQATGQVAELSEQQVFAAVDELVGAGLLVPADTYGWFRYRHPILSKLIYDGAGFGWRLQTHARAARLFADLGADPVTVAGHLELSAAAGDEQAIDAITTAALAARGLAPITSARLFASAIRLLPSSGPLAAQRAELTHLRADSLARSGRFKEARRELLSALEQTPREDPFARAMVATDLVRVERWMGLHDSAMGHLVAARQQLPDGVSLASVMIDGLTMLEAVDRRDEPLMRSLGNSAASGARELDNAFVGFGVAAGRAVSEARIGSSMRALELADECAMMCDQLDFAVLPLAPESLVFLASVEQWLGKSEEALRHAGMGIEFTRAQGNPRAQMLLSLIAESALTTLGRLGSAAAALDDAEELARMLRNNEGLHLVFGRRANLAALQGDLTAAAKAVRDAEVYSELSVDRTFKAFGAFSAARACWLVGQPEKCIQLLLAGCGGPELPDVVKPVRTAAFALLAVSYLDLGDRDSARRYAAAAQEDVVGSAMPLQQSAALQATAVGLLADGQAARAVALAASAAELADAAHAPLEAAAARLLQASALAECGEHADAIIVAQLTANGSEACGARILTAHANKQLRELGVRARGNRTRSGASGIAALSRREREVGDLVADGLTNPQIAQGLFLSTRTVESHLSRIFAKLNARTRADVATAVQRARLGPTG